MQNYFNPQGVCVEFVIFWAFLHATLLRFSTHFLQIAKFLQLQQPVTGIVFPVGCASLELFF